MMLAWTAIKHLEAEVGAHLFNAEVQQLAVAFAAMPGQVADDEMHGPASLELSIARSSAASCISRLYSDTASDLNKTSPMVALLKGALDQYLQAQSAGTAAMRSA